MRRRGVIAALAALVGAMRGQTIIAPNRTTYPTGYLLDLSAPLLRYSYEVDVEATKKADGDNAASPFVVFKPTSPAVPLGLEVRLGSRVVRLTAEQIMDALEGKA